MMRTALLPGIVHTGGGCSVAKLPDTLRALRTSRPFVVTDPFLAKTGAVEKLLEKVRSDSAIHVDVFTDVDREPTVAVVEAAAKAAEAGNHDCIIGFGGGSAMDTAKAVAVATAANGGVGQLSKWKVPAQPPFGLPIIAIPTTSGTGSEATRVTIITDQRKAADGTEEVEKMLLLGDALQPVAALVDYEWTMTCPFRLTADTGVDALCHAVEAYTSRKANDFADCIALRAISMISANLRLACTQPDNHEAREKMAMGSMMGGMAFSNSSVHMIHGMSRPIGAHFKVPHGLSNAMLLPSVTRFATEKRGKAGDEEWGGDRTRSVTRYAEVARAMGCPAERNDESACEWLSDSLAALNLELKVPAPRDFVGADRHEDWLSLRELMATQALASGSPNNCPRIPDKERIVDMYSSMWTTSA